MPSTVAWKGTSEAAFVLALLSRTTTIPPWTLLYCSGASRCGRNALLPRRCTLYPGRLAAHGHNAVVIPHAKQLRRFHLAHYQEERRGRSNTALAMFALLGSHNAPSGMHRFYIALTAQLAFSVTKVYLGSHLSRVLQTTLAAVAWAAPQAGWHCRRLAG